MADVERTPIPLIADQLYSPCAPDVFAFETTDDLEGSAQFTSQPRTRASLEFGAGIRRQGYNLFVMGEPGAGKHAMVEQYLHAKARGEPHPNDWVYVNNFNHPQKPLALELPPGRGVAWAADMQKLVDELRITVPALFESDEYRSRREQIDADFSQRHEKAFGELSNEASTHGVTLIRTPAGFTLAPLLNGEVMPAEEYEKLPETERQRLEAALAMLQQKLEKLIRTVTHWRKERFERISELNREMTLTAVGHLVEELKQRYSDLPRVLDYLDAAQANIVDSADAFHRDGEAPAQMPAFMPQQQPSLRQYHINVVVEHNGQEGSPVVTEENPTYPNLIGRIEHLAQFGTLMTDFTLIKPGALHRALGGYLLLDAHKVLSQPGAWEALKRALSTRCIRIDSLADLYSLVSTVSLEPESIPMDVKVVLFGERRLYYLLHEYDPDFSRLFKVCVDFEDEVDRNLENTQHFAHMVASVQKKNELLPFDRTAVARLVEYGSRLASDTRKLSGNLQALADLLTEADYRARGQACTRVLAEDIQAAIDAQYQRADRLRERVHEGILRGTVMIDTDGEKVGQVNALSVLQLGGFAFAQPTRITATARVGEGQMIDVQREVELGGSIHTKGVLILSSFLAARYSSIHPHSLTASLVFEQTYGVVDGDSASCAELCALLSVLADAPIQQSLAITGSVNQRGQVQAIGGVNEKIEGFFDICKQRGLTGRQGVLIPATNVEHLMLRRDVVDAVTKKQFAIFPITTVDEAIEILTGIPANESGTVGRDVTVNINARVAKRLRDFSVLRHGPSQRRSMRRGRRESKSVE